jgi:hypothetical protein
MIILILFQMLQSSPQTKPKLNMSLIQRDNDYARAEDNVWQIVGVQLMFT